MSVLVQSAPGACHYPWKMIDITNRLLYSEHWGQCVDAVQRDSMSKVWVTRQLESRNLSSSRTEAQHSALIICWQRLSASGNVVDGVEHVAVILAASKPGCQHLPTPVSASWTKSWHYGFSRISFRIFLNADALSSCGQLVHNKVHTLGLCAAPTPELSNHIPNGDFGQACLTGR